MTSPELPRRGDQVTTELGQATVTVTVHDRRRLALRFGNVEGTDPRDGWYWADWQGRLVPVPPEARRPDAPATQPSDNDIVRGIKWAVLFIVGILLTWICCRCAAGPPAGMA
jgi:hypothetical protein